ncbi:MAG: hypothetical protein V4537_03015 [Pseudomonadota bacterium]
MRIVLSFVPVAAALSAVALPAAAQTRDSARAVERLNDPVVQAGLTAAIDALAGIVLDTRVGPLARYTDDIRPNDTLRDVKRRDDPQFEARLHDNARRAIATAGAAASDGVAMSAELARTADRLRAAIAPLAGLAGAYAGGDYDDR